ncbi:MAG: molybdenum cofactor biosynthesis protein MoaE [Pseudomonadota bacterium]
MKDVRLLAEPFDPNPAVDALALQCPDAGGIATFVGKVRASGVDALELSHYEPLTLPGMDDLADTALSRFDLMGIAILHRIGHLTAGEPIVCVSAAARHRRSAIEAVDYAMDHLKSAAWFWKRELRSGEWHWIEPRAQDHADLARWQ